MSSAHPTLVVVSMPSKWIAVLLLTPISHCALAQFVEIKAEIELTSYSARQVDAQAHAKPRLVSCLCVVGSNTWRIEDDAVQNGLNKWYFDGTNVYESLQIIRPLEQATQDVVRQTSGFAVVPFESARSNLTINIWPSPDGHPLGDPTVNIAWLAFCSGTYLKRENRLVPLPCEELRHTPDRYAYTDKTEVFPDAFGLPRSVDLFMSRPLYLASVDDFYKGWGTRYLDWMRRAVTNIQEGELTFHYSVTATTNFLSRTFPLQFEFFQKPRRFLQNEDWYKQAIGTLKSIRKVPAPEGLFNPALQQTIVDSRFRDEASGLRGIHYTWNKGFLSRTDDPQLQEVFKAQVTELLRHQETSR